jgi:hypothetical protein
MLVKNLMTSDQVRIEELNLLVFHRLIDDSDNYLRDNVWNPAGSTWNGAVRSISENTTRDVIGRFEFAQLCPLSDGDRNQLRRNLLDEIRPTAARAGADVTGVDVGEICLPEAATRTLLELQIARWNVQIAQLEGAQQQILEGTRAQAQGAMIAAISAQLNNIRPEQMSTLQMMRLIEALEKLADNPGGNAVLLAELLRLLEQINLSAARPGPPTGTPPTAATT